MVARGVKPKVSLFTEHPYNASMNELEGFIKKHDGTPDPEPGYDKPVAVFDSVLKRRLQEHPDGRRLEKRLVEHCIAEKLRCENELGRDHAHATGFLTDPNAPANQQAKLAVRTHMGQRKLFDLIYSLEMDWRPMLYPGLWDHSNDHIPITRRQIQQLEAKAQGYFFGSDPWFGIAPTPLGNNDAEIAPVVEGWARWVVDRADAVEVLNIATAQAFRRGEGITKTSWLRRPDYYETDAEVVVDKGKPIFAKDGDYIFRSDQWIRNKDENGTVQFILARDGFTMLPTYAQEPDQLQFAVHTVERIVDSDNRAVIDNVDFRDFLIGLTDRDVDTAPFVGHIYDMPALSLTAQYFQNDGKKEDFPNLLAYIKSQGVGSTNPKSAKEQPREDLGEALGMGASTTQFTDTTKRGTKIGVLECYVHFDVFEEGQDRSLMVLVDIDQQKPIFYDYARNVLPRGKRPFSIVRINPVDGRWHGEGMAKYFWRLNWSVDTTANRFAFQTMTTGTVSALDKSAFTDFEEQDGPVTINGGEQWNLRPGRQLEEAFQVKSIVPVNQADLYTYLELLLQTVQNLTGQANMNDNATAGLNTTKTATGINQMSRDGDQMFAPYIMHLSPGLARATQSIILLAADRMPDSQLFRLTDGDAVKIEAIQRTKVVDLEFDITMTVASFKQEQQGGKGLEVIGLVERFMALLPEVRMMLAPVYRKQMQLYQSREGMAAIDAIAQMPVMTAAPAPMSNVTAQRPGLAAA